MPRTSGAKPWGPVEVHLNCIAYHSVSAGETVKGDALQDLLMERYKEAFSALDDASHHLHKYFTDADSQAYLAQRQDKDGAVRHLSPKTLWNRYNNTDLPYIRNTLNTFWFRFVTKAMTPGDSGVDFDDITRRVLAMAWLKNHITNLQKAKDAQLAKAKSAASAQTTFNVVGSLLDSQEVEDLDAATELHGVEDLSITHGLSNRDIVACGGDPATLKKLNITTAETLFHGCSSALDADGWKPVQWRAWMQHGPPAEFLNREAADEGETLDVFPHLSTEATNTAALKETGTVIGRDKIKDTKKRKPANDQEMHLLQMQRTVDASTFAAIVQMRMKGQEIPPHLIAWEQSYVASMHGHGRVPSAEPPSTAEASSPTRACRDVVEEVDDDDE